MGSALNGATAAAVRKIRSFVERVENLDTEIGELSEQKKEVFSEAKGEGFDVKIPREIIKLRKRDQDERDERESLFDLYMRDGDGAGGRQDREGGVRFAEARHALR